MQGLEKAAKSILSPAWISGDPTKISTDHQKFLEEFKKPEPKIRNYIRSGVKTEDLLQWLYEVDHIHLSYGLKYNGVELEKLSPGTKGIVLLILYLGMDTADSEQVIVATCTRRPDNLPHISYASGSFENVAADGSGIRQQVCRILEGGTDAFLKRERRYSLDES
jgi:hypothetical protein